MTETKLTRNQKNFFAISCNFVRRQCKVQILLIGVYISMQKNRKEKRKNIYKTRSLYNNRQHAPNLMPTKGANFIMKMNNLIGENKITKKQNEKSSMKKTE